MAAAVMQQAPNTMTALKIAYLVGSIKKHNVPKKTDDTKMQAAIFDPVWSAAF